MPKISSDTRVLAVIGDPIAHSLSPAIHNSLYIEQDINAVYMAAHVKQGQLKGFINNLHVLNWLGFNVTMPHKKEVLKYARSVSEGIGGANTVRVEENGMLNATSTDADGFMDSLHYEDINLCCKRVVILGAGAVVYTLLDSVCKKQPTSLTFVNRTRNNALKAAEKTLELGIQASVKPLEAPVLGVICENADVLINATPMGLSGYPHDFENLNFIDALERGSVVIDLNYSPAQTRLLQRAEARGLQVLNGLGMLVGQALRAHQFWFSVPPTRDMFEKTLRLLRRNQ